MGNNEIERPTLSGIKLEFYQDTNSVEGDSEEVETLDVKILSHFGIEKPGEYFINIKTGEYGWSIENPEEMRAFLDGVCNWVDDYLKKNWNK